MSQHPSLRSSDKGKQHRSVLKRYERINILKDKEKWKEGESVYGLTKVKIVKFKIKKEKAVAAEGAATEGAAPGAAGASSPAAKAAAPGAKPAGKDTAKGQGGGDSKK